MTASKTIHLGYELGTAAPLSIPLKHMAVTGQTQESGKTTTLEALVDRGGLRAVAFVTKRAEGSFRSGRRIQPYFRERADWQFVSSVLEATLRERLKFERSWIMRASKGAKTLADVQANVQSLMATSKGLSADVYMTLDEYLKIVVPQIETLPYTDKLVIEPGLNVVDLSGYSMELQALVIRSVLEWIYEHEHDTVTIIPEAWEFIPQNRASPVLLAAEQLIRKGAAANNFMWLDSQDIAGVHKNVLRSVIVWLLGVQRETNEVRRMLEHIPSAPKPTVAQVMQLGRGQFYACWGDRVVPVYVQPAGMPDDRAIAAAASRKAAAPTTLADDVWAVSRLIDKIGEDDAMSEAEKKRYEDEIGTLRERLKDVEQAGEELAKQHASESATLADLRRVFTALMGGAGAITTAKGAVVDVDAIVGEVMRRIPLTSGGMTIVVQPAAALRKEFQQREVARVLDYINALPSRHRDALRLLEATEQWLSITAVATRLGFATGGGGYSDFSQGMKGIVAAGYLERDEKRGLHGGIRKKLEADLAVYQPTAEDIEQTYAACIAALAGARAAAA